MRLGVAAFVGGSASLRSTARHHDALGALPFRLDFKNSPNKANLLVLRGTHSFSKRTAVNASLGRISNDGTLAVSVSGGAPGSAPVAGASQSGLMLGVRHNF